MSTRSPFRIPRTVRIAGHRWRVKQWRDLTARERRGMKGRYLGLCFFEDREIYLAKHATSRELASTFLHELMHACAHANDSKSARRGEEDTIKRIEQYLLPTLEQLKWRSR